MAEEKSKAKVISLAAFRAMTTDLLSRMGLAERAGIRFDGKRDYYAIFGWKKDLTCDDYIAKYRRQDIAAAIIDRPADATWQSPPEVSINGVVSEEWEELVKKYKIWNTFERVDRLAGLGQYAGLLIGFKDSSQMEGAVNNPSELLYIHPYRQTSLIVKKLVDDPKNERFGKPELYELKLPDQEVRQAAGAITQKSTQIQPIIVHWSRVIHVAEGILDDGIFGVPRLERCFNALDDLLKVSGGTAETYWLSARKGIQADVDKEMSINPEDLSALANEIEEYQHELRRVIRTRGVKINDLGGDTPDPKGTFGMLISMLSSASGIPQRVLLGSEAGALASTQDRANWAERIEERRTTFAEPMILNPFIERLQLTKLLPEGEITYKWPSAFRQNPLEAAQTMAQKARATTNFARQGKDGFPIVSREEARTFMELPEEVPEGHTMAEIPKPREPRQPRQAPGNGPPGAATTEDGN